MSDDDRPIVNQHIHIHGDHAQVNTAGGDLHMGGSGDCDQKKHESDEKPRKRGRWKLAAGTVGGTASLGFLALALQTASGILGPDVRRDTHWPSAATALCRNGAYSESLHRAGTCSRRGGVQAWRYPASHPIWQLTASRKPSSLAYAE